MFARMNAKISLATLVFIFGVCLPLQALDRWAALSQIESGDDDNATGSAGEISRYQIKPDLWRHYASATADWTKAADALLVAKQAMQDRCATFERAVHRPPTDFEFYVLWNAPARIQHPGKAVSDSERCKRRRPRRDT